MKAKKKTTAVDKQRSNKGQMKTRNSDPPNESCTFVSNSRIAAKKLHDAAVSTTKPLSKTCTAKKKLERDKSSSSSSSNIKVNIEEEPISSTNQSALLKSADSLEDSIKGEKGESTTGCQYERQQKNEEKQDSSTSVKSSSETRSSSKDGKTKAISKMLKSLGIQISGFDNIIPGEEKIIEELKSSISENVKTKSRATVVKVFSPSNSITFSSASSTSNRPILSKKDEKKTNANDIEIDSKNKESSPKKSNDKVCRVGQNSVAATTTTTTAERAVTTEKITKTDHLFTEDSHEKEHEKEPLGETKKKLANKKSKVEVNSRKKKQSKEKHNNDIELEEKEISANQSSLKLVEESDSKQQFEPAEPSDTTNTTLKMKNSKKIDKNISKVEHDLADSCASSSQINLPSAMDDKQQLPPHKTIAAAPPPKGIKSTPKSKSCSFNKGTTAEKPDREQIEPNLKAVTEGYMPSNSQDTASDTSVQGSEQNQPTNNATRRITNQGLSIRQRLQSKYKVIPIKGKKLKVHKKSKTTTGYSKCGSEVKMKTSGDEVEQPTKKDIYDFKSGSESEENIKMELPILKNLRREFSDDDDKPLKINESLEKNVNQQNLTIESSSNIVADPIERDLTGDVTKKSTKKVAKNKTASTGTTKKTDSITDLKKHPTVKVKKGKSAKNLTDNDSTSDSEDEKKLIVFGQKRHRMASLNALAKVQCLYENESRTAYELGLSKTVQVIPKMRTLNSSGSEDERGKDCLAVVKREQSTSNKNLKDLTSLKIEPKEIAGDDSSPAVNIETTKRELRKVPGRGVGKHWEFDSETENDEDIVMIKLKLKKKKLQKLKNLQAKKDRNKEQTTTTTATTVKSKKNLKTIKKTLKILQQSSDGSNSELSDNNEKKKQSPYQSVVAIKKSKKPKREFKEETFGGGDYRGILARKRMASLNASAIVAATYEVERHLDMNLASDCDSFESEIMMATEKSQTSNTRKAKISSNNKKTVTVNSKIDDKITKEENLKDTICKDLNIADESNDSKLSKETKTSTSIDATQKDSVKEGSSSSRPTSSSVVIVQDTDVTITGVYVNSKSGSGQEAYCKMQYRVQSSVTEERVLRPGSTEPPKSYTPLDALSSMRPPGSSNNSGNISSSAVADENLSTTPPQTSSSSLPDSNNSNMYHQPPNDLMVHDMSENSSSYGYRGHHVAAQSPMNQYQQHQYQVVENPSVPMHHYGHPVATSSLATGIHQYQQQQIECDSPSLAYQSNANVYQISNPGSGGGSAFCSPIIQQQQSHQHDVGGYYQPAGPLISPHVLQSTTQPNAQHIAPGSKKQISPSLDPDSEQLQNASQTITVGDNAHGGEVLITGGDLATFRYHSQQHAQGVQGHLQQGQSHQVHHQQQQHQQHIHHQVAAGPVSPYPRSIHAPMHYTSAYPPNYYSPYPGEAMCYSPPYQPYFPTKIYQSAPPPPSAYRRYPPYYQQGLPPPPSASDIYEQTAQSSVGHQLPPPPPSSGGTQIVPTGPAHAQHLEHYPGPPGYYSGYSPGGSRCYTRSIQAPFMEYSPQCPCPMQQSCPKNVHTGPHIGSNTCSSIINNNSLITTSSSNNNNNNNTTTTNNNINSNNNNNNMNSNNISMVTSANNNTIKSNMNHSSNNDSRNNNNTSNLTSSLTNNNKPILYQVTPNNSSTNVNKSSSEQLNTGRGPVKNATYARDNNGDKKQETFTTIAQPVHHNQHNIHHNQSHIIQTCDIKILKPIVKSEIRSEDLDDTKNSQYEEDVVHPPTPPLAFETNGGKCMEKEIVPLELIDDDDIIVEKESENIKLNFDRKISSSEKSANLDGAYDDLSTVAAAPLLVGRKARIGKSMAREMMYAGAAAINQIRILQAQVTTPQRVQQHQQISSQLSPSLCINNNIKNNNNTTDNSCNIALSNDTSDHICANHLHHIDGVSRGGGGGLVGGGPGILLKAEIKAEKEIKKEDDDLILMMHGDHVDNHEIKDIKSEPEYVEKVVKDGTQIGYNDQHSTNNPFLPPPSIMNDDLYMHAPQNSSSGPKRIKILEVHKSQCKRSPTNSYKNLIKQAEPKTYLCLSRKFADKRNRFGKMHKFKQCGIRKRHLILTDQQKRRLRLRKRKIDQCRKQKTTKTVVQHNSSAVRKTVMTKKYITNTKFALTNSIQKNAIKNNKLSSDILNNANNTTTRGYYSEPESSVYVTLSSSSLVERRKIKKSKTSGVRSKSETKRPTNLQLKTIISNNSSPTSIVKQQTEQQQTISTTKGQTMSPMSKAKKIDSENDTKNKVKNNMKVNLSLVDNNKSNKSRTKANLAQKAFSIDPDNDRDISDNKVTNILDNSTQSEQFEINDNSLITTFNNNNNNDNNNFLEANDNTNFEQQAATTIGVNGSTENDDKQIGQKQQQQQQQHVFLQPLPSLPRIICQHLPTTKRTRSRSKFGCRKRQKLKHSVSFEVDETVPLTRTDVIPKWNNGWAWEGEPFQGAVFLNSDDPLVIRTCYPAMRHVEGDIIQTRDCVLLKANEANELPYVAKVAHLWENPEDGEMMMSLLWYYRPEHTEQGRQSNDSPDEVYASRHRDHNSVACVEDKCFVLTFSEYCRYRRKLRASEEDIEDVSVVPKRPNIFNSRLLPDNTNPELVMFCRRAYEFRTKRLLKMPNKQDYYVVNS